MAHGTEGAVSGAITAIAAEPPVPPPATPFAGTAEIFEGGAISATTDTPGGVTDIEIAVLDELIPTMALSAYRIATSDALGSVLRAYIGAGAGRHVLSGRIRPGEGHRVDAAILLADLRGFPSQNRIDVLIGALQAAFPNQVIFPGLAGPGRRCVEIAREIRLSGTTERMLAEADAEG